MKNLFLLMLLLSFAFSCTGRVVEVKSPCVSSKDGPCGEKRPINDWWLKQSSYQQINS